MSLVARLLAPLFFICSAALAQDMLPLMGAGGPLPSSATSSAILSLLLTATGYQSGMGHGSTTKAVPAGSTIVVFAASWGASTVTITGVTDSAGNTYTQSVQTASLDAAVENCALFASINTAFNLPVGSNFTITSSDGTPISAAVVALPGKTGGVDTTAKINNHAAATSLSLASGGLATTTETVVAGMWPAAGTSTWTGSAGFTVVDQAAASAGDGDAEFQVQTTNTGVTWNPSWITSVKFAAVLASYK
jgi:hypothetical protein